MAKVSKMERIRSIRHQPCCGYFLQGGARAIALIDLGLALFSMILIGSEIALKVPDWLQSKDITLFYLRLGFWISYFILKSILICLSVFLFKSSKKRDDRMCRTWLIMSTLTNVSVVVIAITHSMFFPLPNIIVGFLAVYVVYKLYCIRVIVAFIKEIQCYGGFNAALSGLTDAEVEEFEKGNPPELGGSSKDELEHVQSQAFNKDFEIALEALEIDMENPLGKGAFGTVYRAKLLTENPPVTVALKTVSQNADSTYFKTLLGELKIMTFLSQHDNVVNLIGASTSNIKEKKLFIVVEFCPYGNLHEYLKSRRGLFVNLVKDGKLNINSNSSYENVTSSLNSLTLTTADLLRWAYETANGMLFLSEKKVIHGDLATRNVLLAVDKKAKITDFGLSRKLYQYSKSDYVKKKLLPWRWMAIESLKDMTFSTKSDVWSFGVTLWEMCSLSEIPFPGYCWNSDFIIRLEQGLRMHQPHNSTTELYDLMLQCWEPSSELRPNFQEICSRLQKMQIQLPKEPLNPNYSQFSCDIVNTDTLV